MEELRKSKWDKMVTNGTILASAVAGYAIVAKLPMLVGLALGITATGPVSGGWFALSQGPSLVAGGMMSTAQSLVMGGASTKACALGGGVATTIGAMTRKVMK